MKKTAFLVPGTILLFVLSGCTTVKRFKTAAYKGKDNELVEVELFNARLSAEPVAGGEKNVWTLSANAQTRLIQILDERYPDNEQFISALTDNYGPEDLRDTDYTLKDLRMVFTIRKSRDYALLNKSGGRFSPADRIEYLELSLEIPESSRLEFHEWNRYVTEYGAIHIADVSFSRNLDLTLEGNMGGPDLESGASLGRNERQEISQRYLKLNGSISDRRMVIEAEGTREVDLTGNVTADVSLRFDGFPELVMVPVFVSDEDGQRILAGLDFQNVLVPAMENAPDTIHADLRMRYIYRHVADGWRTFGEWDDRVEYYQGMQVQKVPLFLKKDYLPEFYCIGTDQTGKDALKLHKSPEKEYLLQFRNYREAVMFLEWLQVYPDMQYDSLLIGGYEVLYEGEPLTPASLPWNSLRVLPVF